MKSSDVVSGICWIVLGVVVMTLSYDLRLGTLTAPGAGMMPFLLGVLLIASALPVLSGALRAGRDAGEPREAWTLSDLRNPAIIVAGILAYGLALDVAGFLVTTFLFLLALLKLLEPRGWGRALAIAAIAAVLADVVFIHLLDVELPGGSAWKWIRGR